MRLVVSATARAPPDDRAPRRRRPRRPRRATSRRTAPRASRAAIAARHGGRRTRAPAAVPRAVPRPRRATSPRPCRGGPRADALTRRRRAAVLLALALVLGTLSASHMSRREAALRAQLGPVAEVVVARRDLPAGRTLQLADLGRAGAARAVRAGRGAGVRGRARGAEARRAGATRGDGHRGAAAAGARRTGRGQAGGAGGRDRRERARSPRARAWTCSSSPRKETRLALQDVEVLAAKPAPRQGGGRGAAHERHAAGPHQRRGVPHRRAGLRAGRAVARPHPGRHAHHRGLIVGQGL